MLKFVKLTGEAISPIRGSRLAAGLDISSPRDYIIPKKDSKQIFTDLGLFIPDGYYIRTAGRSSLYVEHAIQLISGVIDRDYTGNVGVILYNGGCNDYEVKRGDRIGQMIIEKCLYTDVCEITQEEGERIIATMNGNHDFSGKTTTLSPIGTMPPLLNLRGDNGFGSTGK